MLKKITLTTGNGNRVNVWAWCIGSLAIHKSLVSFLGDQSLKAWSISHVPTGALIGSYTQHLRNRKEIRKQLRRIKKISTWRGINYLDDMPACELLNVMPIISHELKLRCDTDYWIRNTRPILEDALNCG